VNITIDDTNGDSVTGNTFNYEPPATWSVGLQCTNCEAHLDPSQTFDGTWHDTSAFPNSTVIPSASVTFTGSAVYVFCILTGSTQDPNGSSDFQFFIDGEPVGRFIQQADGDDEFTYNFPVYANESLEEGPHTFSMEIGNSGQTALALFDRLVYSTNSSNNGASSNSSTSSTVTQTLGTFAVAPTASLHSTSRPSPSSSSSTRRTSTHTSSPTSPASSNLTSGNGSNVNGGLIAGIIVVTISLLMGILGTVLYLRVKRNKKQPRARPRIQLSNDFRVMPWPNSMASAEEGLAHRPTPNIPSVSMSRSISSASAASRSTIKSEHDGTVEGSLTYMPSTSFQPTQQPGQPEVPQMTEVSLVSSLPNPFDDNPLQVVNQDAVSDSGATEGGPGNYSRPLATRKPVPPLSPSLFALPAGAGPASARVVRPMKTPPPSYFP